MDTNKYLAVLAAFAIALTPAFATARPPGGRGRPSSGGRPASAQARPASRPATQPPRQSSGGFNLNRDAIPATKPNTTRPSSNAGNRTSANNNANRNTVNNSGNRTNVNNGNRNTVNVSGNTVNRTVVANPVYVSQPAWGWNHGAVWAPAPAYWGGGFWGAMAIGVTSAAVYGSIVNSATQTTYTSYQVQPSSPGATVLSNYQLTQVQCNSGSNLVVIYGPNNSMICANPNNLVSAGTYNLDTATLSLTEG
ncbi:MAG TPA: hypothetical protein VNG31_00670 [Candidatus Baltobacteraceae bacterium]|nr:hypothetical protein [Candidatus Baltobacteraceae bacterium]